MAKLVVRVVKATDVHKVKEALFKNGIKYEIGGSGLYTVVTNEQAAAQAADIIDACTEESCDLVKTYKQQLIQFASGIWVSTPPPMKVGFWWVAELYRDREWVRYKIELCIPAGALVVRRYCTTLLYHEDYYEEFIKRWDSQKFRCWSMPAPMVDAPPICEMRDEKNS